MTLDVEKARSQFPALKSGFVFADNAGGSQTAVGVADRVYDYLLNTNVQLGADYSVSVLSTQKVTIQAPEDAAKLINASSPDEIVFGSSSSANMENLARSLDADIHQGDEFILTGEHEANNGPFKKLAGRTGAVVKYWNATPTSPNNPYSVSLKLEDLLPLITARTRIIAFTACSNILGSIVPVKAIVKAARLTAQEAGARKVEISIDCVAYAPHRLIDVRDWDIDYCVFSYYKVYGPHTSVLYVRAPALSHSLSSILQIGGPGYELVYGTTGVIPYLLSLTAENSLKASFEAIAKHEQALVEPLLAYLTHADQQARGVRVVGEEYPGLMRVPTISFVVVGERPMKSKNVVKIFDQKGGVGIRYGHFYAYTLVDGLQPKLDIDDGVVRISLVHYNTVEEVQRIIGILKEVLA
ncbi:pyridoxal phosphate-dependent transferase [Armillaria novae-zelandiae]|uniref:Pyridoxal phosphate-dependent transferase n=1 Tax=Armillaria novae-zelandiae TaxID=153914 RepID=A0AA39NHN2_9AGAR|nr:pyridoxal phosphate-dependent transferase [Armillaria novae-zelandiae]